MELQYIGIIFLVILIILVILNVNFSKSPAGEVSDFQLDFSASNSTFTTPVFLLPGDGGGTATTNESVAQTLVNSDGVFTTVSFSVNDSDSFIVGNLSIRVNGAEVDSADFSVNINDLIRPQSINVNFKSGDLISVLVNGNSRLNSIYVALF